MISYGANLRIGEPSGTLPSDHPGIPRRKGEKRGGIQYPPPPPPPPEVEGAVTVRVPSIPTLGSLR